MRIGLFGGTFDPIHWGHLRSAEEVGEIFSLNRVLFIPASIPPHRIKRPACSAQDRFEMVRLGISSNNRFDISDLELSAFLFSCSLFLFLGGRRIGRPGDGNCADFVYSYQECFGG